MKKWLSLILVTIFLLTANSVVFAKGPNPNKENKIAEKKAVIAEKKADRQNNQAQKEELKQLTRQIKEQHQETVALMKEIKAKRQQIKEAALALKENDQTEETQDTTALDTEKIQGISTDIKAVLSIMKEVKGLGLKGKGHWGQFNQARKSKDIEQAKAILQQISDNITAKNEQLKKISATLDGIIVDLAP